MKLPKEMSATEIAHILGGRLHGPVDTKVSKVCPSPLHSQPGDLSFLFEAHLLKRMAECKASVLVVPEGTSADRTLICVERPLLAMQRALDALKPQRFLPAKGIHPTAVIDETAKVDSSAAIGPLVVVGPHSSIGPRTVVMAGTVIGGMVTIGEDCLIYPNCVVADYIKIGNRVTLQQGASLGADGFAYVSEKKSNLERRMEGIKDLSDEPNPLLKIPQVGTVIVEDDAEIGSCTTIDRATMGATTIGKGTKIDNLVMIAHNCTIGREVLVVAQSAIAGSCKIGDRVVVAGHVGIKDHITVGKDAILEGMAGVMRDVPEADVQVGIPAVTAKEHLKQVAHVRKLSRAYDDIKSLQQRITALEKQLLEKAAAK